MENYELQAITELAEGQSISGASFNCVFGYNMSYGYVTNENGIVTNGVVGVETYDEDGVIDDEEDITEDSTEETTDTYEITTDSYGNILTETHMVDGETQTTTYTYSNDGNYLSSITDENGNTTQYTYDASSGLLASIKDGNGNTTTYTYNALRELASVKLPVADLKTSGTSTTNPTLTNDGNRMQASYTYAKGRLTKIVSGDSTYTFTYDIWGNVLSVFMNSKALATYEYGNYASKGQVQTLTYGNGQKVLYTYDALGQVSTVGYTGQLNRFTYSYKTDGTVDQIYDAVLNQTVVYTENGYEIYKGTTSLASNIIYAYSVDEDGNYGENVYGRVLNHVTEVSGDTTTLSVKDNTGKEIVKEISRTDGFGRTLRKWVSTDNVSIQHDFEYITNGENTGNLVTDYDVSYLIGNQKNYLEYEYTYDGNGNIIKEELTQKLTSRGDVEYSPMGEAVLNSSDESTSYTYDQAGQLKTAYNSRTGIKYYYTYDANGNIVCREEYNVASDNTETLIEKITYVYSGTVLGLSQSTVDGYVRYTNDNMGNPVKIQKGSTTYSLSWGEGRMLKAVSKDARNNVTYSYNADGLRTKKVVKEDNVSTVTEYVWGNNGLAGMETELGTVIVLYDTNGAPVGFMLEDNVYHYVKNLQGDVIRILDANGNTVVEYGYDPWGVPTVTGNTELAKINPCSYRGYDYDEETGYYYLQTRYYDPEIGRFISSDAPETLVLSNNILATNLYTYCCNNSVNYEDPLGFIAANVIGTVIGLVIGIVGGVFLGNWLADKLNLTGWTRNVFVAGIAALTGAASATIGNFIGPYIAKIVGKFGNYVVELVKSGKISAKRLSSNQKSSIKCLIKESCCFVAGTLVLTENGKVPIEQIEIGDWVYATNTETGEICLKKVAQTFLRETNELVHIYINDKLITTTPEHLFWVAKKGWVIAGQLQSGDKLISSDGTEVSVSKIRYEFLSDSVQVYNFEVEGFHTYYVGTEEILVHNTCIKDFLKSPKKYRDVEKLLKKAGFKIDHQTGSHVIFKDLVTGKTVTVPNHGSKEFKRQTLRSILKQAGLL